MSIFWKRRASARSFSKMPRYSWNVVEPMQRSSPEASTGLIRLDASIVPPLAEPAPMMVWISSMNSIAPGMLLQLREHGLQALLEIAAVLGAGDQRAEVERVDHRVGQHVGHVAIDDALGQAFGQRGLAHAGFADVERIVLAAAAQHLDGAFDFVGATDQRIDLAGEREFVEVAGVFGQRVALAPRLPRPRRAYRPRGLAIRRRPAWRCRARGN